MTLKGRSLAMSEFQPAVPLDSLKEGEVTGARVGGKALALYLLEGQPYCTDDLCPHEDCFFTEVGVVEGEEVECACHGSRFNIRSGENTAPPSTDPIQTFPTRVQEGQVYRATD